MSMKNKNKNAELENYKLGNKQRTKKQLIPSTAMNFSMKFSEKNEPNYFQILGGLQLKIQIHVMFSSKFELRIPVHKFLKSKLSAN